MKRSEMVKVLRDSFVKHMNPNGPANNDYLMYSFILRDLEVAGILPPYHNPSERLEGSIQHCTWEPEDEKN